MKTSKNPIIYITRDRERAQSMPESEAFSIISGENKGSEQLDTFELLSNPKIQKEIKKRGADVVVFKNNIQLEQLAQEKGIKLLNPSAELAERIENKVTQVTWLDELASLLPSHSITTVKEVKWNKKPFILQWAHSHTGDGTILIQKESDLDALKAKFPDRDVRITEYIRGPMFTANIVIAGKDIHVGNISYQITGILPFTENPFSTIGNDWSVTHTILSDAHIARFNAIAGLIGNKLIAEGWKGLFGIDVIYDEERDQLFLIEINARQPASTTYESELQLKFRKKGIPGMTTFEAHISALTDTPLTSALIVINDGAQIIQRVTAMSKNVSGKKLEEAGYNVISYKNTKLNADLLRIQSERGIMETHTKFNERGKQIIELL